MPEGITITVSYDEILQEITGAEQHPVRMSKGSVFTFLLHCIFTEYPEIQEKYPPGILCFSINGVAPGVQTQLHEGDEVWFGVP